MTPIQFRELRGPSPFPAHFLDWPRAPGVRHHRSGVRSASRSISTLLSALIFVILTIDSHREFPRLTRSAEIDAAVVAGKHVWHRKNCINCHAFLGEGAYYAPDLTQIANHRGAEYLRAFLKDPAKFYSEERDGRLMPNPQLTDQQITDVIAFLSWVSRIDTQGWPPRPILVKGSAVPGAVLGGPAPGSWMPRAVHQNRQGTGSAKRWPTSVTRSADTTPTPPRIALQ